MPRGDQWETSVDEAPGVMKRYRGCSVSDGGMPAGM